MSSTRALLTRVVATGGLLLATLGTMCTPGTMTATMDVQPDADTVQICVINTIANHTLRVTVLCLFFDLVRKVTQQPEDGLNDRATLVVPSGEIRYVVCQFRKTSAFTNTALRLTRVDFDGARIIFDPNPSVFEDLGGNRAVVTATPTGIITPEVMPGQQLQLIYAGMPGAVTQTFSIGPQATLPANQVIVPQ